MDPTQSQFEELVLRTVRREATPPESPHPSYSDLLAAAGGALSQERMDEVVVHALGCPSCRAALMRATATIDREAARLLDETDSESFVEAWRHSQPSASTGVLKLVTRGIRSLASTPRRRAAIACVAGIAVVMALLLAPPTSVVRWTSKPEWRIEPATTPQSRIVSLGMAVAMSRYVSEVGTSTGTTEAYNEEIEVYADDLAVALVLEVDPLPVQLGIQWTSSTGQEVDLGKQSLGVSPCRVTIPRSELPPDAGAYDLIVSARGHEGLKGSLRTTLFIRAEPRSW